MFQNKSRDKTKQDEEDDQEKPTEVVEFETAVIQGWIQFATFSSTNVPQKEDNIPFYINETYNEQIKHVINADDSDDLGLVNIPNKTSFWAVLMDGSIYILNSRRSVLTRVVQQFKIQDVPKEWITKSGEMHKGIETPKQWPKLNCLQMKLDTPLPDKSDMVVLCFDQIGELKVFSQDVFTIQEEHYEWFEGAKATGASGLQNKAPLNLGGINLQTMGRDVEKDNKPHDGYWEDVNDWSSCSMACGGGQQTKQRRCIPPTPGGKPCEGDPLLYRPCNTQPCPTNAVIAGSEDIKPAAIKRIPLSTDPQTYERCIILIQDMDVVRTGIEPNRESYIPYRIVVNNSTFSVFNGVNYQKIEESFPLSKTVIEDTKDKPQCTTVLYPPNNLNYTVCTGSAAQGDPLEINNLFKDRLNFMKTKCQDKMQSSSKFGNKASAAFAAKMNKIMDAGLTQAEKAAKATPEYEQEEMKNVDDSGNAYAQMMQDAMKSMQRELVLQGQIQQESQQKMQSEEQESVLTLAQEKQKLDQLEQDKYLTDMMSGVKEQKNKEQAQKEAIKEQIQNIVNDMRKRQAYKMRQIDDIQMLKNRQKKDQINQIRIKAALETLQASHIGNKYRCTMGQSDKDIENYCLKHYEELDDIQLCKDKEEFCYQCCNAEFGTKHPEERQECYQSICGDKRIKQWKEVEKSF